MKSVKLTRIADPDVQELKEIAQRLEQSGRAMITDAIRAGEILTKKKSELSHGQWLPWLENKCPLSQQTASRYVRLYELRGDPKLLTMSNLTDAYRLLTNGPAKPERTKRERKPATTNKDQAATIARLEKENADLKAQLAVPKLFGRSLVKNTTAQVDAKPVPAKANGLIDGKELIKRLQLLYPERWGMEVKIKIIMEGVMQLVETFMHAPH